MFRGSIPEAPNLITVVCLHQRYLEPDTLLLTFLRTTSRHLHFLEKRVECFIMAFFWLSAAQLPEQVEFVVLNTIAILGVITVNDNVYHLSRVVLIIHKSHFTARLRSAKRHEPSYFAYDLHFVVLELNFLCRLVNIDIATTAES